MRKAGDGEIQAAADCQSCAPTIRVHQMDLSYAVRFNGIEVGTADAGRANQCVHERRNTPMPSHW